MIDISISFQVSTLRTKWLEFHAFVSAKSRLGLLPVIFTIFLTELWPLIDVLQHEKRYSWA